MPPDHQTTQDVADSLEVTIGELMSMTDRVAHARQVKEFSAERRRNLLSKYVEYYQQQGGINTPMAKLEAKARADSDYLEDISDQSEQLEEAERVLAKWQALQCQYEARRSLLSFTRETMKHLEG